MRRLAAGRGDEGTTITELLVVMFILSLIITATVTLSIGLERTNAETMSRQDQIDVARTAVERMSKTLRSAVKPVQLTSVCGECDGDAFIWADGTSIRFFANLNNEGGSAGPSLITYAVATTGPDAGVLVEKAQLPRYSTPSPTLGFEYCDAEAPGASEECKSQLTTRRLAEGVVTTEGPVFTYFNAAGTQFVLGAGGLVGDELAQILSIELTLTVQGQEATQAQPTTYIQRILLPNSQAVLREVEETP